jgi:zinc/manganese transport system substrate-binding protein
MPIVVYHRDFSYARWLGLRKPAARAQAGCAASPAHLAELVEAMKRQPAKVVIYSPYNSPRAAEFLSERTGIPALRLPFTVGGSEKAKDLFALFDDTIAQLLGALK